MKNSFRNVIVAALLALVAFPLVAQEWPTKPITIMVPFAIGGTADIVARLIGPGLNRELGQPVVVDNKGGAGGTIATAMVARAPGDGYTILIHHMGITFNAWLYDRLPYDTLRDIAPVAYVGATPNVLVVSNKLGVRNVEEFLALARQKPNTINYGSGGVGSAGHLPMELLQSTLNVRLVHVPYKGSGPAITDLIAGQIDAMLLTIPAVISHIQIGRVRAIATSGTQRSAALPSLPTLAEAGVKDFEYAPWYGFFAPSKTPPTVMNRLHAAVNKVLSEPEVVTKLRQQGLEVRPIKREQFVEIVRDDVSRWGRIIKTLGIKGE